MHIFRTIAILTIKIYQLTISPFFPPSCRYEPTCSTYFVDALKQHGIFYGSYLGICRLLRCRPGGSSGYDPVPKAKESAENI